MDNTNSEINEYICEIRYKPNPKVLDFRGVWAEAISNHLHLAKWQIIENRVDVFNEKKTVHAFVSFHNIGITMLDLASDVEFSSMMVKLLDLVMGLEGFDNPLFVERIGVRSRYCTPFSGTYAQLLASYQARYLSLTEMAKQAIGVDAALVDVGGPLFFEDRLGHFNTLCGPMPKEQFLEFFTRKDGFPDVGLYYDIDYWVQPKKGMRSNQINRMLKDFSHAALARHQRIRDLLLKG